MGWTENEKFFKFYFQNANQAIRSDHFLSHLPFFLIMALVWKDVVLYSSCRPPLSIISPTLLLLLWLLQVPPKQGRWPISNRRSHVQWVMYGKCSYLGQSNFYYTVTINLKFEQWMFRHIRVSEKKKHIRAHVCKVGHPDINISK